MPTGPLASSRESNARVSVQDRSAKKVNADAIERQPCPTHDCPYTASDECAQIGCPQRFKRSRAAAGPKQNGGRTAARTPKVLLT